MTKVLGFDISSKCIGWAYLSIDKKNNIKRKKSGVIFPKKTDDFIDDLANTRTQILEIIEDVDPDYIVIEDIVKFMKGKSSAQTIVKLATYNRMICLLSYDYLCESPKLYNVLSIRHGIKLGKKLPSKEEIPALVSKRLNFKFNYRLNRNGKIKEDNYDEADAIAVALYGSFCLIKELER